MPDEPRIYPCADCGTMRTKAEGGTVFTVCDDCWDKKRAAPACLPECGEKQCAECPLTETDNP